jgi:hypothetical protein
MPSPVLPSDADAAAPSVFANVCAAFKSMFDVGRLFRELINWMFTATGELSAEFIAMIPFPPPPTPPTPLPQLKAIPTIVSFTTAGATDFTVPANVYSLDVEVVGGGGGGSSNAAAGNVGGGGGGYGRAIITVTPGQVIAYEVGAGGVTGNPGANGGDTTFGGTLIGRGGKGGDIAGSLIAGGTVSGADIGAAGWAGGSTWPGYFGPVGTLGIDQLIFYGGKSGHPLCHIDHGIIATPSTLGRGGPSNQPSVGGSSAIVAGAGIAGAVIITYLTWTAIP